MGFSFSNIFDNIADSVKGLFKDAAPASLPLLGTAISGAPTGEPGLWSMLTSTALDLGSDYLKDYLINDRNSQDAFNNSLYASAEAFDRSYNAYKNRYQDTVADMKAAGLNPLLLASSGFNVGKAPEAQPAQSFMSHNPVAGYGSTAKNLSESSLARTKTQSEQERITLIKNEADQALANAAESRARAGLLREEEKLTVQKVWNAEADFYRISSEAYKNYSQDELNIEMKKRVQNEYQKLEYELSKLRQISNIYDSSYGKTLTWAQEILKTLNIGVAIVPGLRR